MTPGPIILLIVEDSFLSRFYLGVWLKLDPTLEIHKAENAAEAAAMIAGGLRPTVVLLDLEMPGGDGEELFPAIRSLGAGAVRTVIVSGTVDLDRLDRAGRNAPPPALVLRKKVDPDELLAAIRGESPAP